LWVPEADEDKHGEINSSCLFIIDGEESEAWLTFEQEICEFKFKEVPCAYRTFVNSLIEVAEVLPRISQVVREERALKALEVEESDIRKS